MSNKEVVALSAVRSAVGAFGGSLAGMEPAELGGLVVKAAIESAGVDPKQVTFATVGNCIPTESRYPYVARVATIQGGMSMDSVAFAVNRLCGSAQQAIVNSAQAIMLGDADFAIGGGVELGDKQGAQAADELTEKLGEFAAAFGFLLDQGEGGWRVAGKQGGRQRGDLFAGCETEDVEHVILGDVIAAECDELVEH